MIHAGSRDYDEGVYWQSIRAMVRGEPLFRSVFASQPPAFYYALLPFYLVSHSLTALRLTVLCFALIGIAAIYIAGRMLGGPAAGLVAAVLLLSSPLYIQEAAIVQADMPAVAVMVVAVALVIAATRRQGQIAVIFAILAGVVFAIALGMKLFAAVAVVPMLFYLLTPRRQPLRLIASFAGATLVGLVIILVPAYGSAGIAYEQLVSSHLLAGRASQAGIGANLEQMTHLRELPLIALALASALIAIVRRDERVLAPLGWAIAAIVAILTYQPLFPHHLLLLSPALALTASIGFGSFTAWRPALTRIATLLVTLAVAAGLVVGFRDAQRSFIPNGHDAGLAKALRSLSRPEDYVISDSPFAVSLADRDIPGPLVDTSHQRIAAGLLTVADLDAARDYYGVKLVLTDGGRLKSVPGFSEWLATHYRLAATIGRHAAFYVALQDSD